MSSQNGKIRLNPISLLQFQRRVSTISELEPLMKDKPAFIVDLVKSK
jgi:hypothetical protein